jgi:hypothetical protein
MRQQAERRGKTMTEQQGEYFIKIAKKQGWLIAPTVETLVSVANTLKGRLKRKPGVTPKAELSRRIRARGTFARGWVTTKIESVGFSIRIWVMNKSAYSEVVDNEKKVFDKSKAIAQNGFKQRLEKLADQITQSF